MVLYLGEEKVPYLERGPQFMGVLIEGFHSIYVHIHTPEWLTDLVGHHWYSGSTVVC